MSAAPASPLLLCIGNPLLDLQVTNGEALLEKYGLKPNDAILATEKQQPIYDDIVKNYKVHYVAGGAAQNTARGAQYCLPPGHVAYIGAVGADSLADQLRAANEKEGVLSAYQVIPDVPTGACAVILTGHNRSLCTSLQAAEKFTPEHLSKPEIRSLIDNAKYFYITGFFLTHGIESALEVAKIASGQGKLITFNLSAPFVPQFFKVQLDQLLPYVDVLIGNDSEAQAYAEAQGMASNCTIEEIALSLANVPKHNPSRPRLVIITQGAESTLVASSSPSSSPGNLRQGEPNPKTYPVDKLPADKIVDTNGAGDAFAGGFLAGRVLELPLDECIAAGHKMGQMSVGMVGPTYVYPKVKIL